MKFHDILALLCGCHRRADRSFFYKDKQFPVCARCTGEIIGALLAIFIGIFAQPSVTISFLMLIPMIVDGTVQYFRPYESNNKLRATTGALFGGGAIMLAIHLALFSIELGKQLGQMVQ
ncbi:DUF2085 domain-containing protein [Candidatus Epulonipiscium viviparus]|uniref:DUF2085 domain-containing protein n=1 Tax=Candidatus Epulonipiscium viviparus TaxID=420336 RepID=UPI00273814F5|nr:DUF2085 domain-containing protein [Candidatus Epulopiscium viviparus]